MGEGGKEGGRAAQRDTKQQTHRKRKKSKTRTPEDLRHQNKKPETLERKATLKQSLQRC